MIPVKNSVEYYQEINCTSYYSGGNLTTPKVGIRIQMIGLMESGMFGITNKAFEVSDVLMLNIHINSIPFDKLMGSVKQIQKVGDLYKMEIEFMGMPNALFDKIKELIAQEEHVPVFCITNDEIEQLENLVQKLKNL